MRLLDALARRPLDRPPVWFMRQAGRYLPEYRELRSRYGFQDAIRNPDVAAEITLQPLRRFPLDAAIVFADIMTPLEAMGVEVRFDPGPKLAPHSPAEVSKLPALDPDRVGFLAETIRKVRAAVGRDVAVIGFAGAPATLLAYLLEGSGSRHFAEMRRAMREPAIDESLQTLAESTARYLEMQVEAGVDVVQLFDSWAGILSVDQFEKHAAPAARACLMGLDVPTIYFAPAAPHLLASFPLVEANGYGVDWRLPLDVAWKTVGYETPIQGNLDPAALLTDPATVAAETDEVLEAAGGRPGHIFNLGHGILPTTPIENVEAMVETVVGRSERSAKGIR